MDVAIRNEGSIYLFRPCTDEAYDWIEDNVQSDAQWWAGALVVEHGYAASLAEGMFDSGLILGDDYE